MDIIVIKDQHKIDIIISESTKEIEIMIIPKIKSKMNRIQVIL